jgi:hypothetical protein
MVGRWLGKLGSLVANASPTYQATYLIFFNHCFMYLHKFITCNVKCQIKKLTKVNNL